MLGLEVFISRVRCLGLGLMGIRLPLVNCGLVLCLGALPLLPGAEAPHQGQDCQHGAQAIGGISGSQELPPVDPLPAQPPGEVEAAASAFFARP